MRNKSLFPPLSKGLPWFSMPLVIVLWATTLTAQQGLWESLIDQGNRALATGDATEARKHFDRAWEVAADYPAHDLRRATTQRNLAQARMLLGDLEAADSLYTRAIACADRTLEPQHQYPTSLRREQALLREALAASQIYNEEQPVPLTVWEALAQSIRWTANHSTGGFAMSQPLGELLATSHDRGLGLDLSLDYTWRELGSLPLIAGLDYFRTELPNKHADNQPGQLRGTGVHVGPALGRYLFTVGAGSYALTGGLASPSRLGFSGGLVFSILGRPGDNPLTGPQAMVRFQARYLLAAEEQEAILLLQLGLTFGFRGATY